MAPSPCLDSLGVSEVVDNDKSVIDLLPLLLIQVGALNDKGGHTLVSYCMIKVDVDRYCMIKVDIDRYCMIKVDRYSMIKVDIDRYSMMKVDVDHYCMIKVYVINRYSAIV